MKQDLSFIGPYGVSISPQFNSEDTINLYIEYDKDGKKPSALIYTPGILASVVVEQGAVKCRQNGLYSAFGYYFVVIDQDLYRYSNDGDKYFIGILSSATGYISWANTNGVIGQLVIVDGVDLFVYNILTNVFTKTNFSTLFPNPQAVYFQDARFVVSCANSSQYPYSAQGDGTSYAALNFLTQQSRPDVSIGISGANERLFLFGAISTEIWAPVLTPSDLPYYRDNNLLFEIGAASIGSIIKGTLDSQSQQSVIQFVFWLSTNVNGGPAFVLSTGSSPIKVSDEAIDLLIGTPGFVVSDCYCVIYKENGHTFIECSFPTQNITLFYDVTVGHFTRLMRLDDSYSLINSHVYFNNLHIVGSRLSAQLYYLSRNYLTENGAQIKRTRITKIFSDPTYNRMQVNWLEVDFESGIVDPTLIPYAFMSYSIDGGLSYSSPRKAQIGQVGQYHYKTYWRMLGSGYSYTFKIEVYDAVRVIILGASIDYEIYTS